MKYFKAAGNLKYKHICIPIIDSLVNNLEKRSREYEETFEKFDFLESLHVLDQYEITKQCEKLANFYNKDLNSENARYQNLNL
jgi:hypothetical protein